ncbi:Iron-chelate-transporting ATPase [Thiorhodococcus drewsii AZ1]|uniref:Iron-chelate-transporting ATPase n=1 Tax=Thiorhodococcus drewsii AZ1 TaxID=765913 RepID=G2E467_9GAMM|nr:ABC transporter ATP-binding protein [Thiorhodococcus drewsii]EGV29794.1 Iron-chelate-transporting ATPase [Thiorhodococcus drewsii AZ1]
MSLDVHGLSFAYPDKPVLQGIDTGLLPAGALTALLGPNAAGKSTLFRCIAGILRPQTGAIRLGDRYLLEMPRAERARRVCYMPQTFASAAALTVFEVVLLARKHLQDWRVRDEDVTIVERMLHRCGVTHLAERHVAELSGGQQQMVSICQAMVRTAEVFLLDEPTSALDLRHQLETMRTLRDLTLERKVVTVAAMHDLNLAARFADHLLLMRDGRVLAAGPKEEILSSPVLAETYGVEIELARTSDGNLMVAARL